MSFRNLNVIEWGVEPDMPFEFSRKTRLVNTFALIASGTTLPYVFIFLGKNVELGLVVFLCFLLLAATWLLNRHCKYHLAKIWLYIASHLYLFIAASALGKASGEQMVLIPVIFSAILLFESKEKYSMLFVMLLNIATFLGLEFTDYSFYQLPLTAAQQQHFYYGSLFVTLLASFTTAAIYLYLYGLQLKENKSMIETRREIEQTINYFSTSTFGKNSIDEILWDVTKNCVSRLGLVDCVIYLLDDERQCLVQKAAYGPKNPKDFEILQPLDIPLGQGIVGHVAKTGRAVLVNDTTEDPRYLSDSEPGLSELAVPLIYDGSVIGVIDSEHPEKNFFTEKDLGVLKTISALCANKVACTLAEQERENALRIQMEAEKIKSLDELKNQLFANVSHELRTPLTLMTGTIDQNIDTDETGDWKILKKNTNRLLSLINQILDLTKLESGHFKLRPGAHEIRSFLRELHSLFVSTATLKGIELHLRLPKDELWLNFDRDAMEKILTNLISNALKYAPAHSEVIIRAEYEFDELLISVSDQGKGISPRDQKRIFDRYVQIENTSHGGTGIGLALTRELVELHGGSITVESEIGAGAIFFVSIPLERSLPMKTSKIALEDNGYQESPKGGDGSLGKHSEKQVILIIEDNHELAALIKKVLMNEYEILTAFDGEEGLKMAKESLPDLIISDVMMPIKDGIALSNELKRNELTGHIPIVLLTAKADIDSKLLGLQTGADDYIVKPFNARELQTRAKNLMAQRKKLREKYSQLLTVGAEHVVIPNMEEVFMKKLLLIIECNLDNNDLSIQDLCLELGVSRMQLHRKLTALTGQSATTFIRHQRLLFATKLLEAGEAVSQVAYKVGFNSLSYFSRAFKEQFGVSPSEFYGQKA